MSYSYNKRKHEIDRFKRGESRFSFIKIDGRWKFFGKKKDKPEGLKGDQGMSGCVGVEDNTV
jgi:hypothetical protein